MSTVFRLVLLAIYSIGFTQVARADNLYFVHTDHLGTPAAITDASQNVVWQGDKLPFGETDVSVNQIEFNVRFPGQYFDSETGLHYNYFRDYDPSLGRYVQSDPIGLAGGLNTYGYAYQNPVMYIDPTGETPAAGLCFIPGVGWIGCGAVAVGVGIAILTAALINQSQIAMNSGTGDDSGSGSFCPGAGSSAGSPDPCELFPEFCPSKSTHANQRAEEGRAVNRAHNDAQRATESDVFIQSDGRVIIRGSRGREHIFESNGELVTTINNRSNAAHVNLVRQGVRTPASHAEAQRILSTFR